MIDAASVMLAARIAATARALDATVVVDADSVTKFGVEPPVTFSCAPAVGGLARVCPRMSVVFVPDAVPPPTITPPLFERMSSVPVGL